MIEHAARAGLILDEWQQLVLHHGLGYEVEAGAEKWTASKVSCWVPRQNGKGAIIEALELYWLFVMGEPEIVHSAHEHATSEKAYRRLERLIRDAPHLHRRVRLYRQGSGKQRIELRGGQVLQYATRSGTAARGFSTPKLVLDEGQELTEDHMAAILPTVSAMPNWQVWFFGTPPRNADAWCYGLKADGEAGVPRLAHFDWGADLNPFDPADVARIHDRDLWFETNPAAGSVLGPGVRILEETIEDEARPSGLGEKFIHERLGAWLPSLLGEGLIDLTVWADWFDPDPVPQAAGPVAFSLDVHPDLRWSAIGETGRRSDGLRHWKVLAHGPGMAWLLGEAVKANGRPNCGWFVDPSSPAGALIPEMERAGLIVHRLTVQETAQACVSMLTAAKDGPGRHGGDLDVVLTQAWRDAMTITSGDSQRFARRKSSGDITPLMVVTLSDHGFRVHGEVAQQSFFAAWR